MESSDMPKGSLEGVLDFSSRVEKIHDGTLGPILPSPST